MTEANGDVDTYRRYRQSLFDAGVLVPTGVDGIYGRSGDLERIVDGLERMVGAIAADLDAVVVRFPPIEPRSAFVRSGYLRSFPDMAGDVRCFTGDDRGHRALLDQVEAGEDWGDQLSASEAMLCPAVCHPLYPTLAGGAIDRSRCFDLSGYVFRHEPSPDPARMMAFRMHEIVYVGTPEGARQHRDRSLDRALETLAGLGIEVTSSLANDPFFGRVGRVLANSQRAEALKYEVLAPTSPVEGLTAIASANCHEDHFGQAFALHLPGGEPAHSACVGYGLERIALALLWAHGPSLRSWPADVRGKLGP